MKLKTFKKRRKFWDKVVEHLILRLLQSRRIKAVATYIISVNSLLIRQFTAILNEIAFW